MKDVQKKPVQIRVEGTKLTAFDDACADRGLTRTEALLKMIDQIIVHRGKSITLIDSDTGEHIGGPKR